MLILIVLLSIACAMTTIGQWFVYQKAGQPGWYALVPFLNGYKKSRIAGNSNWVMLRCILAIDAFLMLSWLLAECMTGGIGEMSVVLFCAEAVVFFSMGCWAWVESEVADAFGKGFWFAIGLALLPFVFYPILAFGKSEYKQPKVCTNNHASERAMC